MASYKPYIKKSNDGAVDELPLDATTLGGIGANGFARASHTHTKDEVGLGNVDNTADANKSVKYATTAGSANSVAWTNVSNKPTTYPPDSHTHNYLSNVATISGGNTSNYPWRRIMSIPSTTSSWVDVVGTYYLSSNYHGGAYYLFRVAFRTNNSANGSLGNFQISVIATNSDPANLAIASYSVATNNVTTNYSDIFVKVTSYPRMTLTRLSAMDIRTINYYNSNEGDGASSRTEAYTEINGSGTGYASSELHSLSAYTYVNKGELSSKVSYANSAGSVPWGSVTNKPSTFPPDSHTHSYLPLDGSSAMSGAIILPENAKSLKFRNNSSYEVGTFYGTSGNEALTFYTQSANTSFQFINGSVPGSTDSWKTITPGLQIKNNKVLINKKVGDGTSSNYNLEVNGTIYASNEIISGGGLDITNTNNGIKMSKDTGGISYFVTNIEAGSKTFNVSNYSGTTGTVTVSFHNGSKGSGSWYVVASAYDPGGTDPSGITVSISSVSPSGCTFKVRRNINASGNPSVGIYWIAIKYW